jgi:hypothetical protein
MAFIMPFLILLAMGIIDLGRALYTDITINEAAQEGAIYASFAVRTPAQVEAAIIASVDNPDLAGPETVITYSCPAGVKGEDDFTITVTHEYSLITPIAGLFGGSIELDTEIDGQIFYGECP